ncbi:MAG: beta-propeller fold lactonase family protein [Terriglobales bacterium]
MPSKRVFLILIAIGLAPVVGCGSPSIFSSSSSSHTAYVTLPNSNAVAAFRIKTSGSVANDNTQAQFTTIVGSPFPAGSSPSSVLVHPSSQYVYVANRNENNISLFTINSSIGSLQEVLPRTTTGLTPISMVMDSGGNYLFVANELSSNISVYAINSSTGALSAIAGSPFSTYNNPFALAITPSGKFLYVLNPNLTSVIGYTIASGVLHPVAGLPAQVGNGPRAIAVDPAESFVYVANSADNTVSVLGINSSTGALTLLGAFATGTTPTSVVALDPYLYVANQGSSNVSVFTVTPNTGVLTQITSSPFSAGTAPLFAVLDPDNLFLYIGSQSANTITALSIDTSTGALTETSQAATTGVSPSSMSVTK